MDIEIYGKNNDEENNEKTGTETTAPLTPRSEIPTTNSETSTESSGKTEKIIDRIFFKINELDSKFSEKLETLINTNYKICTIKKINYQIMKILLEFANIDKNNKKELDNYNNALLYFEKEIKKYAECNFDSNTTILTKNDILNNNLYADLKTELINIAKILDTDPDYLTTIKESIAQNKYSFGLTNKLKEHESNLSKNIIFNILIDILEEIYNLLYFRYLVLEHVNDDNYAILSTIIDIDIDIDADANTNEDTDADTNEDTDADDDKGIYDYLYIGSIYDNFYYEHDKTIVKNTKYTRYKDKTGFIGNNKEFSYNENNEPNFDKNYILIKFIRIETNDNSNYIILKNGRKIKRTILNTKGIYGYQNGRWKTRGDKDGITVVGGIKPPKKSRKPRRRLRKTRKNRKSRRHKLR